MKNFDNKLGFAKAQKDLLAESQVFKKYFTHGTLEVELYAPNLVDNQTPHSRDEVYIIASGESLFHLEGKTTHVSKGDFLFVPAGKEHRFIDFSKKFSTWVIFYGPEGGEKGKVENLL